MGNNKKYSREKDSKGTPLVLKDEYRRDEIVEGLKKMVDFKGISRYFTPDETAIF
jgi:hypothetical protein